MAFEDDKKKVIAYLFDVAGNPLLTRKLDDAAFAVGTDPVIPMGMLADETSPDSVDEGDVGIPRMTLSRIPWAALRVKGSASADTELIAAAPADNMTGSSQIRVLSTLLASNGVTGADQVRTIASSGAGLGVLKTGTLGELITLAASAARTESANGTAVTGLGWRNRYIILFDLTVADTDAGDTLDVYVDVSLDGNTWLNTVHFTQIIGTDSASKRFAVLDPAAPGTSEILVTADAAAGAVRPSMFGAQMRARWAITDAGTDDASFTFSVVAYAI